MVDEQSERWARDVARLLEVEAGGQRIAYGPVLPDDIPRLLELYRTGHLKLDELVTTEYALEDVALGYEDMHAGRNIRGVVVYD